MTNPATATTITAFPQPFAVLGISIAGSLLRIRRGRRGAAGRKGGTTFPLPFFPPRVLRLRFYHDGYNGCKPGVYPPIRRRRADDAQLLLADQRRQVGQVVREDAADIILQVLLIVGFDRLETEDAFRH